MRFLAILAILTCSLATSASDPVPLRVAMFTEFEPMVFVVSGEIQGIEVDFAAMVSEQLNRPLEVKTYRFPELIGALENGEVDVIMSGFSVTESRANRITYTVPYMEIGQMAIVRVEDASELGKPNGLETDGLKIGVHTGSTGEVFAKKTYNKAKITGFGGVETGLQALRDNKIDAFIHDSTTSWQLNRSFVNDNLLSLNRYLTRESIAWAVRKEDVNLLAALNLTLEKLKSEGKVAEVLARWLPVTPSNLLVD